MGTPIFEASWIAPLCIWYFGPRGPSGVMAMKLPPFSDLNASYSTFTALREELPRTLLIPNWAIRSAMYCPSREALITATVLRRAFRGHMEGKNSSRLCQTTPMT